MAELDVQKRLFKLESRAEVSNIVGKYSHYLMANAYEEMMNLWADKEDTFIEIGASGKYIGKERVATYYQKDHIPGKFLLMQETSPIIEIADDLQSARGLWLVIANNTDSGELGTTESIDVDRREILSSASETGERYTAEWQIQKLGIDFQHCDGTWKINHLHIYDVLIAPHDQDWVSYAEKRFSTDGRRIDAMFKSNRPFAEDKPPENLASEGTRYHWQYQVNKRTELEPLPPMPYKKLDEANRF